MDGTAARGLTRTGAALVAAITLLSVAHHVDHVVRGVTGWPFAGGFNAFSGSLFVYPVIALGVALSRRDRVGPLFWSLLAGGGALFILAVHVGPAAADDFADIPEQHDSPVAGTVALIALAAFLAALVTHAVYELRRLTRNA